MNKAIKLTDTQLNNLVQVAVQVAIETYIRGVTQTDIDTIEEFKEYPNVAIDGVKAQTIVEDIAYKPKLRKRIKRAKYKNMKLRKYRAVYLLKIGQSTFYAAEDCDVRQLLFRVKSAACNARKHYKVCSFSTACVTEHDTLGVRIYRTA